MAASDKSTEKATEKKLMEEERKAKQDSLWGELLTPQFYKISTEEELTEKETRLKKILAQSELDKDYIDGNHKTCLDHAIEASNLQLIPPLLKAGIRTFSVKHLPGLIVPIEGKEILGAFKILLQFEEPESGYRFHVEGNLCPAKVTFKSTSQLSKENQDVAEKLVSHLEKARLEADKELEDFEKDETKKDILIKLENDIKNSLSQLEAHLTKVRKPIEQLSRSTDNILRGIAKEGADKGISLELIQNINEIQSLTIKIIKFNELIYKECRLFLETYPSYKDGQLVLGKFQNQNTDSIHDIELRIGRVIIYLLDPQQVELDKMLQRHFKNLKDRLAKYKQKNKEKVVKALEECIKIREKTVSHLKQLTYKMFKDLYTDIRRFKERNSQSLLTEQSVNHYLKHMKDLCARHCEDTKAILPKQSTNKNAMIISEMLKALINGWKIMQEKSMFEGIQQHIELQTAFWHMPTIKESVTSHIFYGWHLMVVHLHKHHVLDASYLGWRGFITRFKTIMETKEISDADMSNTIEFIQAHDRRIQKQLLGQKREERQKLEAQAKADEGDKKDLIARQFALEREKNACKLQLEASIKQLSDIKLLKRVLQPGDVHQDIEDTVLENLLNKLPPFKVEKTHLGYEAILNGKKVTTFHRQHGKPIDQKVFNKIREKFSEFGITHESLDQLVSDERPKAAAK